MKRPPLWTLLAIPLLAIGAWFVYQHSVAIPAAPTTQIAPQQHLLSCQGSGTSCKHVESTPYYNITVNYPNTGRPEQVRIEQVLVEQVNQFKSVNEIDDAEKARLTETGRKYAFAVDTKSFNGSGYSSYEFDIMVDTGGAHPNSFYKTLVFKQGTEVTLEGLFKPGSRYLDRLSAESYKQVLAELKQRSGGDVTPDMEDTVRIGTSPTPETLQNFVIDGTNLVILIPPYQAAAYAAGSFEVKIPLSSLQDILK
ncbi:DUF3298 and DUF4163 domain-containing protein [Candidatus Parcubacteria bacterium]|nr:DUF3298 and DUF4163 domain-containing protein [Candidatus Parcubacteria bacterium]